MLAPEGDPFIANPISLTHLTNIDVVKNFVCSTLLCQFQIEKKAVAKPAGTVWQLARKPAQATGPYQVLGMASLGYSWLSWVAQPS